MIIFKSVKAKDAFSYKELQFDFRNGVHSVTGANGSSKTSLFLLVQQCLFNKNAKDCRIDEVNNSITASPYEIEVEFEVDGENYRVVNSRKTGKIDLYCDGVNVALRKIPEVLAQIEEILGTDYETFRDLTYQSKNSSLNLLDASTNKGRVQFVNNILKLAELDSQHTRLNNRRKQLEGKRGAIALLEQTLADLELSLSDEVAVELPVNTVDLEDSLEALNKRIEKLQGTKLLQERGVQDTEKAYANFQMQKRLISELKQHQSVLSTFAFCENFVEGTWRDKLNQVTSEHAVLVSQIAVAEREFKSRARKAELLVELQSIVLPDKSLSECREQLNKISNALSSRSTLRKTKIDELARYQKAAKLGVCPTCMSEVSPDKFDAEIQKCRDEIKELADYCQTCTESIQRYEDRIATWEHAQKIQSDINRISGMCTYTEEDVNNFHQDLKVYEAQMQEATTYIVQCEQYQAAKKQVDVLKATLSNVEEVSPAQLEQAKATLCYTEDTLQQLLTEKQTLQTKLNEAQAHNIEVRTRQAINQHVQETNLQTRLVIASKEKELASLHQTVDRLKLWVDILGPKGYRTVKTIRFLNTLNQTMQKYARLMCDGKIVCTFHLSETGEIAFEITDEAKTQDIALWSGGESARIKMVCLFAILELLEAMGTSSFNLLCLDEIFSALDQEGKEGLFKVLNYLKKKNKALYVIAHEELALDMMYDSVIKAEKQYDGTTTITQ